MKIRITPSRRALLFSLCSTTIVTACGGGGGGGSSGGGSGPSSVQAQAAASSGSTSSASSSSVVSSSSASSSTSSSASSSSSASASPAPTPRTIVCWGDSLTEGVYGTSYPAQLAALVAGASLVNNGIGGQTSTQIAMRQGGVATKLTLANNQIVAGGNTVTAINGGAVVGHATYQDPDYRLISTPAANGPISVSGTIAGTQGTLTATGSGGVPSTVLQYTFTPTTAPASPVSCPAGSRFSVPQDPADAIAVLWVGRNNYTDPTQIQSDIAAMIAAHPNKKFIVLSVLNGDFPGETLGLANWTTITQLNAALKSAYPANYIDIRATLVAQGAPGTPYADASAYANDMVPSALRGDQIHLNQAGNGLVAAAVQSFILDKGW